MVPGVHSCRQNQYRGCLGDSRSSMLHIISLKSALKGANLQCYAWGNVGLYQRQPDLKTSGISHTDTSLCLAAGPVPLNGNRKSPGECAAWLEGWSVEREVVATGEESERERCFWKMTQGRRAAEEKENWSGNWGRRERLITVCS